MTNEEAIKMVQEALDKENKKRTSGPWPQRPWTMEEFMDNYWRYESSAICGVGSVWGFEQAGMTHLKPGNHPMGRVMVKSLYKSHSDACPELKNWTFVGWQFCRYNKRIPEALGYWYYHPPLNVAEKGAKKFVDYEPLPLYRATGSTLANCGFREITMSDTPDQRVLGKEWPLPPRRWGIEYKQIDPKEEYMTRTINSLVKKIPVRVAVRVAVIDWVLHPSRLKFLEKIAEDSQIKIIRPAHISRRSGHACLRLMVGRHRWKTWREILKEGNGPKEITMIDRRLHDGYRGW